MFITKKEYNMNNKIFSILIVMVLMVTISGLSASMAEEKKSTKETEKSKPKITLAGLYGSKEQTSANNPFSQSKFVPGISFILDFSYVHRDLDQEIYESLEVPGFIHGHSHEHDSGHTHAHMNAEKGFNLNYGELVLYAAVDPYFDLFTTFHLSENSFEIEEAYVNTRSLPFGFRVKLGKFLSGFGRINAQHAHYWDFVDIPLVYRSFFGEHGLLEKGVQLNWVAPTDFYLGFGIESLQGVNENSFGTEEFNLVDAETEEDIRLDEVVLPNAWVFFGKTSVDIGDFVVLAGASYAIGKTRINHFEDDEAPHGFAGDAKILGFDFTVKYIIDSYRSVTLQAEYISRNMDGTRYGVHEHEDHGNSHQEEEEHEHDVFEVDGAPLEKNQAGLYTRLVYRFHKLWRLGAHWDWLNKNNIRLDGNSLELPDTLNRYSFMIDFNPTEFSRIRLQYNLNRFAYHEGGRRNYHGFVVQFNLAIGAHGAHAF
jgi:hypothetical protein